MITPASTRDDTDPCDAYMCTTYNVSLGPPNVPLCVRLDLHALLVGNVFLSM